MSTQIARLPLTVLRAPCRANCQFALHTRLLACCLSAAACCLGTAARGADWPAYGADASRSCRTNEALKFPLEAAWAYVPAQPPRPAWPEPGKERHRLDFDYAPQPVMAHGLVYFGSSADDTVRALDAATGQVRWQFTTGGPVRFAPAIAGGKAYVVSDDGWLYALDAVTGMLVWKFRGAPRDDQILGNGRM
ncbi:MAG: PQQ-binding-like beta-propeller repeat protein, partial [Planctomycetota bacterium]|nr:PQQ-binding-like beta-propeller repeat protein [Planctomycetota bacterium]